MKNMSESVSVSRHFANKDELVRSIYDQLVKTARRFGPVVEDPKKTSIHLVNSTAFAGVATRKTSLTLTLKADHKLSSERIHKCQQVSRQRFYHEVKLTSPAEVDAELTQWLQDSYALSS